MNIKKSPLMAGLLTLNAIFGAMSSKAEETTNVVYKLPTYTAADVFGQQRLSVESINGVTVSLMNGLVLSGKKTTTVKDGEDVISVSSEDVSRRFPIAFEADGTGFARGYDNMSEFADMTVNKDTKEMWASFPGMTNVIYKIDLHNISPSNMLSGKATLTEVQLSSSANEYSSSKAKADKIVSFGEWLLLIDKDKAQGNTKVYHKNGYVNYRNVFDGVVPTEKYVNGDKVYLTDGEKTIAISKANPETGIQESYEGLSGVIGLGVVDGTLYQATMNGVYNGTTKQTLSYHATFEDVEGTLTVNPKITHMTSDGERLIIAHDADKPYLVKEYFLNDTKSVLAVQGATKVIATDNGVQAFVKNQLVRVHE